ncbi:MAG: hypothetical protein E6X17_18135 [Sporomusaceae bacterium]|nr:hypothetical protein [Sporomusaceae bacterium]
MRKSYVRIFFLISLLLLSAFTVQGAEQSLPSQTAEATGIEVPPQAAPVSAFTGLIIDARGLGLETTFAPAIFDEAGRPVYGVQELDPALARDRGMVDYASTPDLVRQAQEGISRAGTTPMIITALRLADNKRDIIISTADAEKVFTAAQTASFLGEKAVVFFN